MLIFSPKKNIFAFSFNGRNLRSCWFSREIHPADAVPGSVASHVWLHQRCRSYTVDASVGTSNSPIRHDRVRAKDANQTGCFLPVCCVEYDWSCQVAENLFLIAYCDAMPKSGTPTTSLNCTTWRTLFSLGSAIQCGSLCTPLDSFVKGSWL